MATGLDVWITKRGSACRVDNESWIVTVYDAHNNVFQWTDVSYTDLPAPSAHWSGRIPPGTYVVQATNVSTGAKTDHAIVTVECGEIAGVLLFVAPSEEPDRPRPRRCKIDIATVTGMGSPVPTSIHVTGTAVKCKKIELILSCRGHASAKTVVSVPANGQWKANLKTDGLECRCGGRVSVEARCLENPDCRDRFETDKLRCGQPGRPDDAPR